MRINYSKITGELDKNPNAPFAEAAAASVGSAIVNAVIAIRYDKNLASDWNPDISELSQPEQSGPSFFRHH